MTKLSSVYIIQNKEHTDLYWNNSDGWGSLSSAEIFEHDGYDLPIDGQYVLLSPEKPLDIDEEWM